MEYQFSNRSSSSPESQKQKLINYLKPDTSNFLNKRLPITTWLPKYTLEKFLHDLLAGFTVALTEVPQSIAYARVATLPVQYGLYSFMGGFAYAIFGTCKDVNQGPTSLIALIIQPHVIDLGPDIAVLMSFFVGLIVFMAGVLNMGFLIEFFSYPIIAGFTCAGALQIASSQFKGLLGITGKADFFLEAIESVIQHIDETSKWDAILSLITIITLLLLKYIGNFGSLQHRSDWSTRRNFFGKVFFMLGLSRSAIVVLIGTALAYGLGDNNPFQITGEVDAGFPPLKPPPFSTNGTDFSGMVKEIGSSMAFLPLVAILEAISIAKNFSKGRPLDASQEMIALGMGNMMGSFFSSMPITGSFSRSAINNSSGVKTSMSGVITSCFILLAIAVLTPTFKYVPKATLSSVIVCAMMFIFDYQAFIILWRAKKSDLFILLVTFLSCLLYSLEYGILIGIGVNLLFVLYSSARPKINVIEEQINNNSTNLTIYMMTPQDTLYFSAAEHLRDTILAWQQPELIIILNGKNIRTMDVTVANTLSVLTEELALKQQEIVFVNFKNNIIEMCVKVDEKLKAHFKEGELKDILQRLQNTSITTI